MNYKTSVYNLTVDCLDDAKELIYNTYSSAFCLFDENSLFLMKNLADVDYDALTETEKAHIDIMKKLGFIVPAELDEYKRVEFRERMLRYSSHTLALTIGPTIDCNMCCPYCYEPKIKMNMTDEVIEAIKNFVAQRVEQGALKGLQITWYGGEPLLRLDVIQELSEYFIQTCEENDITYRANIITNGYLLNYNTARLLSEDCQVRFAQVTIDGLEEIHNQRRKLKNGKDSFRTIIDNLTVAKDFMHISVRVNVDKTNAPEVEKLTDFFIHELKWTNNPSFYLAPVSVLTETCKADAQNCIQPKAFSVLEQNVADTLYEVGEKQIANTRYPRTRPSSCAAISASCYVIDPEGNVYTCWNKFGDREKRIGNLLTKESFWDNPEYLKWLTLETADKCKQCVYLPLCHGWCPDARMLRDNDPQCTHHTYSYLSDLKRAYKYYLEQKASQAVE